MMCAYCKALDADVAWFNHGDVVYVCGYLCLEGFLDEKRPETPRVASQHDQPEDPQEG